MKFLLALTAGAISVTAFEPFGWWYLLIPTLGLLFHLWKDAGPWKAFRIGFCFGLGQFGAGVSWVYVSIQTFGGMPPVLAGACVLGLVCVLSLFPAIVGWIHSCTGNLRSPVRLGLILPAFWILLEWIRGWLFTGLPWLSAGYAFVDTPLSGLAPVGGVYLVGLISVMTVGVLVAMRGGSPRITFLIALIPLCGWVAGVLLDEVEWTREQGEKIRVALIQNNVPLLEKWEEGQRNRIIREYLDRTEEYRDHDLVVWPEGAVPEYLQNLDGSFWTRLQDHPADIAFGALHRPPSGTAYYNSLVAVGDEVTIYNKQHLVPFGEFFPMQGLLDPILRHLTIPMSDFSPWQSLQRPLPLADNLAAASICYEDAFPQEWRNQVPDSGFLLNVSEDMWFGDSLAPYQRLQMARFRARESERPMVRSSNNGLSSLINWRGRVTDIAPQFQQAVVSGTVQPRTGVTPFIQFGNLPVIILSAMMAVFGVFRQYSLSGRK